MNRVDDGSEAHGGGVRRSELRRAIALMSVPFVLVTVALVYLVWFGETAADLRGVAAEERRLGVEYALEHTPLGDVPHLWAAQDRPPTEWDRRSVDAVVSLVKRSDWPELPDPDVEARDLVTVPPTEWSAAQRDSVAELLRRFDRVFPKRP